MKLETRIKGVAVFLMTLAMSVAAWAAETQEKRMKIVVETHDADESVLRFDSDEAGFSLDELQLGESRSIVDKDGNTLFVVRTEDGFEFDVGGRKIEVPDLTAEGLEDMDIHEHVHVDGEHEEHEVRIVKKKVHVTN